MTEEKLKEHIKEVLSEKDFLQKLVSASSAEEVVSLLADKKIDLAPEAAKELLAMLKEAPALEGEVSDENMAQVAGGDSMWEKVFLFVYEKGIQAITKKLIK